MARWEVEWRKYLTWGKMLKSSTGLLRQCCKWEMEFLAKLPSETSCSKMSDRSKIHADEVSLVVLSLWKILTMKKKGHCCNQWRVQCSRWSFRSVWSLFCWWSFSPVFSQRELVFPFPVIAWTMRERTDMISWPWNRVFYLACWCLITRTVETLL